MNNLGNVYFPKKGSLAFARDFVAKQMRWAKEQEKQFTSERYMHRIQARQAAHHIYMTLVRFRVSVPVVTDEEVSCIIEELKDEEYICQHEEVERTGKYYAQCLDCGEMWDGEEEALVI